MSHAQTNAPPPGRTVAFVILTLLAVLFLIEGAVLVIFHPPMPARALAVADSTAAFDTLDVKPGREKAGLGFRDPSMTLHPYLGYVFLPKNHRPADNPGHPMIPVSDDGFLDPNPAVRKRAPGKLIVGITGGSVAGQLGTWHHAKLEAALKKIPDFAGNEPEFVWLGMPGYHQPQQVIQLAYVLAQGGEFDYVLNLDGFNELAVPAVLNAPQGAHPLYPMNWSMVALDVPDPTVRVNLGAIDYLKEERNLRNDRFARSPWRFSPTARLLHRLDDDRLARALSERAWQLSRFNADEVPYFVSGPERFQEPTDAMLPDLVEIWKRSSEEMHALCAANGIRYIHFLQPNQYDIDSKPLSADEKEKAFEADGPYRPVIEKGYPMLRKAGQELKDEGIAFYDLSFVFRKTGRTLYVDNCCHFNGDGNEIMAAAIAEAVGDAF